MFLKFFPQRDFEDKCLKVHLIYLYILPSNFFFKREWEVLFTFSLVDISDLAFFPPTLWPPAPLSVHDTSGLQL